MKQPPKKQVFNADLPIIILVQPQMGRNIGAAIRAMVNCGLHHLRLVRPREGWPNQDAVDLSSGGIDHLSQVDIFDDLSSALADCHISYGTTARLRDMAKPVLTARQAAEDADEHLRGNAVANQARRVAFVFGPERTGLINDDLALCSHFITIPLNPEFSSLNLAQAVLLVAYEYAQIDKSGKVDKSDKVGKAGITTARGADHMVDQHASPLASHRDIQQFFDRLIHEIDQGNFFRNPDIRPHLERNLLNFFTRATPTDQELRTWQGILSALIGHKKSKT